MPSSRNSLTDICTNFPTNVESCPPEIPNTKDFINECDCT